MMTMCLTFKQQILSALIFVKSDRNDLQREAEREVGVITYQWAKRENIIGKV